MDLMELIQKAKKHYAGLGKQPCPALAQDVHFTSHGFQHIFYKKKKKRRDEADQIRRLKLIHHAQSIVNDKDAVVTIRNRGNRTEWGLSKNIGGRKITVVLAKVSDGDIKYQSIVDHHIRSA